MPSKTIETEIVADAYLALLAERGIDYLFANGGTDFAPVVEAYARAEVKGIKVPKPITVPHENTAVAMAHGYYMATGRPQAVMLHVNVGTANGICGILNAMSDHVPIFFSAGRTPLTESGMTGSRNGIIHWAQEMYDQAGMVREAVKWDYELRNGLQLEAVVDRALQVAMSEPRGPIYLSLPREVLAEPMSSFTYQETSALGGGGRPGPDPQSIARAAEILGDASLPVIITRGSGGDPDGARAITRFAERFSVPVVEFRPKSNVLPSAHPMWAGFNPAPYFDGADAILVIENDTPWVPALHGGPGEDCKVIHLAVDPFFENIPIRSFRCDLAIQSAPAAALDSLSEAMTQRPGIEARIEARRPQVAERHEKIKAQMEGLREKVKTDAPIHPAWLSHCIGQAVGDDAVFINEYPLLAPQLDLKEANRFFANPPAAGLGWCLGAALGMKMGQPDKLVVATMGDGSYMLNNPIPGHYVSRAEDLPLLYVIFNNSMWNAVRGSTLAVFPDGYAAKSNRPPISPLEPSPDFHKLMDAFDGYGEKVEDPAALPEALQRAVKVVREEKRQALLNVQCRVP